jgi:hypothetical protein
MPRRLDLFILQRVRWCFDTELPQDFQDCIENGEVTLSPIWLKRKGLSFNFQRFEFPEQSQSPKVFISIVAKLQEQIIIIKIPFHWLCEFLAR